MDFPGKDTGVGCHSLLQGTSPLQGLNLGLLRLAALEGGSLGSVLPGKPCVQACLVLLRLALLPFTALRFLHVGTLRQPCIKRVCRVLFQQHLLTSCLCPVLVILMLFQTFS